MVGKEGDGIGRRRSRAGPVPNKGQRITTKKQRFLICNRVKTTVDSRIMSVQFLLNTKVNLDLYVCNVFS